MRPQTETGLVLESEIKGRGAYLKLRGQGNIIDVWEKLVAYIPI